MAVRWADAAVRGPDAAAPGPLPIGLARRLQTAADGAPVDGAGRSPVKSEREEALESAPSGADAALAQVAGYRLLRCVGSGGMGAVYEAERARGAADPPVRVAIKILHEELRRHPAAGRFLAEARAAARVRHPGVVVVHGGGRLSDGRPYITMELLRGAPLAEVLPEGAARGPALFYALRRLLQICEALCAVHAAGVIHRDLKPQNVLVVADADAPDGVRCKLLDFGLARLASGVEDSRMETRQRTRPGFCVGTPKYMAPEQCLGQALITDRADSYAVGVMLYRALTGRAPFTAALTVELLAQQCFAPAPQMAGAPAALEALTLALLRKEPSQRPSVAIARDVLRAFLLDAGALPGEALAAVARGALWALIGPSPAGLPTTLSFRGEADAGADQGAMHPGRRAPGGAAVVDPGRGPRWWRRSQHERGVRGRPPLVPPGKQPPSPPRPRWASFGRRRAGLLAALILVAGLAGERLARFLPRASPHFGSLTR